jgi:hypothetical protein
MSRRNRRDEQRRDRLIADAHADYLAYSYRWLAQETTLLVDFPWAEALQGDERRIFAKELASFEEGDERILLTIYSWRNIAENKRTAH